MKLSLKSAVYYGGAVIMAEAVMGTLIDMTGGDFTGFGQIIAAGCALILAYEFRPRPN